MNILCTFYYTSDYSQGNVEVEMAENLCLRVKHDANTCNSSIQETEAEKY